jgi:uncharacterized protein YjbI with pentapeptide repeats
MNGLPISCHTIELRTVEAKKGTDAGLYGANLEGANLTGAILENANLVEANLQDANLDCTDLTNAYLENAKGADLKKVKKMPDGKVSNQKCQD